MSAASPGVRRRPHLWWFAAVAVAIALSGGAIAAGFTVTHNTGSAGGIQNGGVFLTHWQQTEVTSSTTPFPVPGLLSQVVTAPTRLANAAGSLALNAATAGHQALEWSFTESVGMPTNEEVEVALSVHYTVGTIAHTVAFTVYLESQATAIGGSLVFSVYWDTGATAGTTFGSESEISQGCSGVGTCP